MCSVVKAIQEKNNFHGFSAATEEQIRIAQKKLGLSFSTDYKDYVAAIGVASFDGHELTGLCFSPRIDVVSVTEKCRESIPAAKPNWYVLEELNIDQITIWQDGAGSVYRVIPNDDPVKIAQGIIEYINL